MWTFWQVRQSNTLPLHNAFILRFNYKRTFFWIRRWLTDFFCFSFMLKHILIYLHINDKWEREYVLQFYLALMFCRRALYHFTCAICMIYIICEFKSTAKLVWLSLLQWIGYGIDNWGIVVWFQVGTVDFGISWSYKTSPGDHPTLYVLDDSRCFSWGQCVKGLKVTVRLHIASRLKTYLLEKSTVAKLIALDITDWIATHGLYAFQRLTRPCAWLFYVM